MGRGRKGATDRSDVLMITEGTYPYVMGGVSTCCHQLLAGIPELRWDILALVTPTHRTKPAYDLIPNARLLPPVVVWEERSRLTVARVDTAGAWVPATILRSLVSWGGSMARLTEALLWCRSNPRDVSRAFSSSGAWEAWHEAVDDLSREDHADGGRFPDLDRYQSAELYRTIHWIARVAAAPTPPTRVLHVTAAGWAGIPAIVHKALHGTPLVLTEHGVYVREAYLAWSKPAIDAGDRTIATRVARGLARAVYHSADIVAPVTNFNVTWERALGADEHKIRPILNGIRVPEGEPAQPPGTRIVTSVGRIDPLKDVKTMLRVAAEVVRLVPDCTFVHHGPVAPGQGDYNAACRRLHKELGLGDRFRFEGPTRDPQGAVRKADVVLLTSISEGLPMAVLEAMSEARPVVGTNVGGVPEVLGGVGLVAPPGAVHQLAGSVAFLLKNPATAHELGLLGRERVAQDYDGGAHIEAYRDLFGSYLSPVAVA